MSIVFICHVAVDFVCKSLFDIRSARWCYMGFYSLAYRQLFTNFISHSLICQYNLPLRQCCLICFIPIVHSFLTHWPCLQIVPFTIFFFLKMELTRWCDRPTGDAYSHAPDFISSISRSPCLFHSLNSSCCMKSMNVLFFIVEQIWRYGENILYHHIPSQYVILWIALYSTKHVHVITIVEVWRHDPNGGYMWWLWSCN
jgi:hypothetical protein